MPRCPLCTTDPKNPVWHRSMRQCPRRGNLLRKEPASKVALATPEPGSGPPGAPAPGKPIDETKPVEKVAASEVIPPGGKPKKRLFGFVSRETQKIRDDVSKPKQEFDWILPEEANARIWQAGLSFLRQTLNLFNRFMGMPPIPDELMRFGKADLDSINEAFRAPTSKLLYAAGFRTVESAVRFTLVFSGFSLFGLMIVQLGLFYWENLPKSERYLKWREKAQARALKFREGLAREQAARAERRDLAAGAPAAGAPGAAVG